MKGQTVEVMYELAYGAGLHAGLGAEVFQLLIILLKVAVVGIVVLRVTNCSDEGTPSAHGSMIFCPRHFAEIKCIPKNFTVVSRVVKFQ